MTLLRASWLMPRRKKTKQIKKVEIERVRQ